MFSTIPIVQTSIPTGPSALPAVVSALAVSSVSSDQYLELTGKATSGSGSLYLLRWFDDLAEWRPWREYHAITVDSSTLGGFFSASYLIPQGNEYFLLYDPAAAITATAKGRSRTY